MNDFKEQIIEQVIKQLQIQLDSDISKLRKLLKQELQQELTQTFRQQLLSTSSYQIDNFNISYSQQLHEIGEAITRSAERNG